MKAFSTLSSLTTLTDSDSEKKTHVADDVDVDADRPAPTPLPAHVAVKETTPKTPIKATPKSTPAKTPRTSKKALALAEQGERATYAQSLFEELNRSVFAGGLPVETTLIWSNRLLTTAGRARWHRWVRSFSVICYFSLCVFFLNRRLLSRSKEGVHTTSIELATKILDCKGKLSPGRADLLFTFSQNASEIRCHMRCAISPAGLSIRIRKKATGRSGNHGEWLDFASGETCPEDNLRLLTRSSIICRAAKVMRKRPDIDISVCVPILIVKSWRLRTDAP